MTNEAENPRAVTGSNRAPIDELLKDLLDGLSENLLANEVELIARYDELREAFERTPEVVDSAEMDARFGDFVKKQLATLKKAVEAAQEKYKRPFTDGGKVVDGTFKRRADEVERWQRTLQARQTAYKLKVEEEARKKAAEEARKRAEEEEKARKAAEEAAAKAQDAKTLDDAIAAEEAARNAEALRIQAEQAQNAKTADLTRTRGDLGSVSSLRKELKGEVIERTPEIAAALMPLLDADALNKALRQWLKIHGTKDSTQPPPTLKGARIYWDAKTR